MAMIHFLGTGSAFPSSDRDNTSLLFSFDKLNILVDVSGNPSRKIKEAKKSLCDIDIILLTHTHIDHIYGIPSLLWGMWLENRTEPLTIFTDYRNEDYLNKWLHTILINEWGIQFEIRIQTFNGDNHEAIINNEQLKVCTFPAIHSVPTVGYEFLYQDKRIVYSADTEINQHINQYQHIDILVHEATFALKKSKYHSSMDEVLKRYSLNKLDKLILVHLSEHEPYQEVYDKFIGKINEKDSVQIAYDQMKVIL